MTELSTDPSPAFCRADSLESDAIGFLDDCLPAGFATPSA
jgi:hypothetical protein